MFFILFLQNVDHKAKFRSKKGQLPFVELNGEEIADSAFIIKELSEKFNKDLDACKYIIQHIMYVNTVRVHQLQLFVSSSFFSLIWSSESEEL